MTAPKPLPKIAPCPWCGSEHVNLAIFRQSEVFCESCDASGPGVKTPRGAINAWNRLPRFSKAEAQYLLILFRNDVGPTSEIDPDYAESVNQLKTKLEGIL